MATLDFESFVESTHFITESEEQKLRNTRKSLTVERAIVNAVGEHDNGNWLAGMVMLESQYESLLDLMELDENDDPVIDTEDLRESDILSLVVSDNESQDIENIINPEKINPGDEINVEVSMNQDSEGNWYLNGANAERIKPEVSEGADKSLDPKEVAQRAGASAQ